MLYLNLLYLIIIYIYMKNSLNRGEIEVAMVNLQEEAISVNDKVNAIIQRTWVGVNDTKKIQTISDEVIAENWSKETAPQKELLQKLGFISLVKLSNGVYLANKEGKYTLTNNLGELLSLEIPGETKKHRWFNNFEDNGDGIIFYSDVDGLKWKKFLRYQKSNGEHTGIRSLDGSDFSSKVWGIRKTYNSKIQNGLIIYIKERWFFKDMFYGRLDENWVIYTNLEPVTYGIEGSENLTNYNM